MEALCNETEGFAPVNYNAPAQTVVSGLKDALPAFKEAAAQADADVTWRGREGMTPEYSRHLAEVTIYDALERAAAFARGRNE